MHVFIKQNCNVKTKKANKKLRKNKNEYDTCVSNIVVFSFHTKIDMPDTYLTEAKTRA